MDHYPWSDAGCAALIADFCAMFDAQLGMMVSAPTPVLPPPGRFVKFGDSMICQTCKLDARYCKGHAPQIASSAQDGQAAESLAKRIKECRGGR